MKKFLKKKKSRAILSAEDYLKFQQIWESMKDVNHIIVLKSRDINQNLLAIKNVTLANKLINKEISDLKIQLANIRNECKKLSLSISEKYNIDMTRKGAMDPITREWKSEEALEDEAGDMESVVETLETIKEEG